MWSKLISDNYRTNTAAAIMAKDYYDINNCAYHNWQHILDCYTYLEQSNTPYDENLDYAVLYHDVIYDEKPNKELRSADFLLKFFPGKRRAAEIIMATETHNIKDSDWQKIAMIKADLHQLTDSVCALQNYVLIMREAMQLNSCTMLEVAQGNKAFMSQLSNTVIHNKNVDNDDAFWDAVYNGIELTMRISDAISR